MTEKLFKENSYTKEASAVITGKFDDSYTLSRTVFFPEMGGQPSDIGKIRVGKKEYDVIYVYEKNGEIYHKIDANLEVGVEVNEELDWDNRFTNMQRHSGEHILTGILYREYGAVNRGFHMGENYITIDLSLEEDPRYKELTWDMVKKAEYYANEVIWNKYPFVRMHFDKKADANKYEMRKKLEIEEDITLVGIKDMNTKWGLVACCGTHVENASEVGLIKAFKVEPNKGMFRVYFECGKKAFIKYQEELEILQHISRGLSVSNDKLLDKLKVDSDRNDERYRELQAIKQEVYKREAKEILESNIQVKEYNILKLEDLMQIARIISKDIEGILFLVSKKENAVLLVSNKYDCNKLVKENANIYNAKGGGTKETARAIFTNMDYTLTFIDLIIKHLK